MPSRKVDLEAEWKRTRKPGAGYPIHTPARDPVVEEVDRLSKKQRKHPAQR